MIYQWEYPLNLWVRANLGWNQTHAVLQSLSELSRGRLLILSQHQELLLCTSLEVWSEIFRTAVLQCSNPTEYERFRSDPEKYSVFTPSAVRSTSSPNLSSRRWILRISVGRTSTSSSCNSLMPCTFTLFRPREVNENPAWKPA